MRNMHVAWKYALGFVGFVAFVFVAVIAGNVIYRDQICFEAGGKMENAVCMPVNGAITFPNLNGGSK